MCYVGKATKIFIFVLTVLVVTSLILTFSLIRRHEHHNITNCTGDSCHHSPPLPNPIPAFSASPPSYNTPSSPEAVLQSPVRTPPSEPTPPSPPSQPSTPSPPSQSGEPSAPSPPSGPSEPSPPSQPSEPSPPSQPSAPSPPSQVPVTPAPVQSPPSPVTDSQGPVRTPPSPVQLIQGPILA